MVDCRVLLVLGLAFSQCLAQAGVTYLRSDSYEIDSDEHGQFVGDRITNCSCGVTNKFRGRIVGGKTTEVSEYPHMAGVGRMGSRGFSLFCGGAIVTEHHVITAAHCTEGEDHKKMSFVVGEHDLSDATESKFTKLYMVDEVIDHPSYDTDKVHFDISILVTKRRKIQFNMGVGPICLPTSQLNLVGQYVKVTGWGKLAYKGDSSSVLMKVNLRVVDLKSCATHHDESINLVSVHQFCTYSLNKDSCQGDSGGPVAWLDQETNRYTLVGVVSFGKGCAGPSPGVNTDVSVLLPWIMRNIHRDPKLSPTTCCKV